MGIRINNIRSQNFSDMKNLKTLVLALVCLFAAFSAQSQGPINSISHTPNPAFNGNNVTARINIDFWSSCHYFNQAYIWPNGNALNIYLDFDVAPGICLPVVLPGDISVQLGALNTGNYTLNFYDWDSNTYLRSYNLPVYGNSGGGSNSCSNPVLMSCGDTYSGSNNIGTYSWNSYTSNSGGTVFTGMTGPETKHQFTLNSTSNVTITLGNLLPGKDLDLMLSSACSNYNLLAWSGNSGNLGEQIVMQNLPAGTYRIIVDGYNGAVSTYTLSLSCYSQGCGTPSLQQITVTNIGQASATFNCAMNNVIYYQYRYKLANSSTWTTLSGSATASSQTVNNLLACSNYEMQCRVYCNNGWSNWSATKSFSTQCAPSCPAPSPSQISATDIGLYSARLNCSVTGVQYYDWAYRPTGGTWIPLPTTTTPYTYLSGLSPNTTYEYQVSVYCYNNTWSAWSVSGFFTTQAASSPCDNATSLACGSSYSGSTWAGINFFSSYGCAPWDESGPERAFRVQFNSGGTLRAMLSGMNFDGDVFILRDCFSSNCLAAGDVVAEATNLAPGTYYVIVDGYEGEAGNFTISINCGNSGGSNDEPCGATVLQPAYSCIPTTGSNISATTTYNPSPVYECDDSNVNGMDVWLKFVMPSSGHVYYQTFAGSMTDAVVAFYGGSNCNNLTYGFCLDDTQSSRMPSGHAYANPGTIVYVRVWGWGGSVGTFSICIQTLNNMSDPGGEKDAVTQTIPSDETTDRSSELEQQVEKSPLPESVMSLYPVPARDQITLSVELAKDATLRIQLFDLAGQMVYEAAGVSAEAGTYLETLDISDLPAGIYIAKVQADEKVLTQRFVRADE